MPYPSKRQMYQDSVANLGSAGRNFSSGLATMAGGISEYGPEAQARRAAATQKSFLEGQQARNQSAMLAPMGAALPNEGGYPEPPPEQLAAMAAALEGPKTDQRAAGLPPVGSAPMILPPKHGMNLDPMGVPIDPTVGGGGNPLAAMVPPSPRGALPMPVPPIVPGAGGVDAGAAGPQFPWTPEAIRSMTTAFGPSGPPGPKAPPPGLPGGSGATTRTQGSSDPAGKPSAPSDFGRRQKLDDIMDLRAAWTEMAGGDTGRNQAIREKMRERQMAEDPVLVQRDLGVVMQHMGDDLDGLTEAATQVQTRAGRDAIATLMQNTVKHRRSLAAQSAQDAAAMEREKFSQGAQTTREEMGNKGAMERTKVVAEAGKEKATIAADAKTTGKVDSDTVGKELKERFSANSRRINEIEDALVKGFGVSGTMPPRDALEAQGKDLSSFDAMNEEKDRLMKENPRVMRASNAVRRARGKQIDRSKLDLFIEGDDAADFAGESVGGGTVDQSNKELQRILDEAAKAKLAGDLKKYEELRTQYQSLKAGKK